MKKLLILLTAWTLCVPSYAHIKSDSAAKRIRDGRLLQPRVSTLSRMVNNALERQLNQISKSTPSTVPDLKEGHKSKRGRTYRSTFILQHGDSPFARPVSGFAIDLLGDGKVWGVTAGHAMRTISIHKKKGTRIYTRDPHIKVQIDENSFIIAPIDKKTIFIGNPEGIDVALFEIPKEVLPYVTVLRPAEYAPSVGQEATIRGIYQEKGNQPFTLVNQKVLFSTPLKLFLQKTSQENITGFCGSPGFIDGLVSMVYIGFDNTRGLTSHDWFKNLSKDTQSSLPNIHYAVPINLVKRMAKSIKETGSVDQGGIMMNALGRPIAWLKPNQSIVSIEQLRNGEQITKINSDRRSPINPHQLELFFELEENDILRISLDSFSMEHPYPNVSIVYDVNVSTGEVTKITREDPL